METSLGLAATMFLLLSWLWAQGRVVLAWLPPGRPGSHQGRGLASTWAASHLLGLSLVAAWGAAWERALGRPDESSRTAIWVLLGLVVTAGIARWATLPAAEVSRTEPALPRDGWLARLLRYAAIGVTAWGIFLSGDPFLAGSSTFAALALVLHALDLARAATWAAGAALLVVAGGPLALGREGIEEGADLAGVALCCSAAAAAGTIGWLRRGDRRELALAAIACGAARLVAFELWPFAVAPALWLVLGTPRPARGRAALWCGAALAIGAALGAQPGASQLGAIVLGARAMPITVAILAPAALAILAGMLAARRTPSDAPNPSGAPRGHEERVLLRGLVTALALGLAQRWIWPGLAAAPSLLPSLPIVAILAGIGLSRTLPARARP